MKLATIESTAGRPISKRTQHVRGEIIKVLNYQSKRLKTQMFTAKTMAKKVHAKPQEARVAINWLARNKVISSVGHAPQTAPGRPEILYVVERRNGRS